MPKSIATHKDPLSTNPIEPYWPNTNRVELKLNRLQIHRTNGLGFTDTLNVKDHNTTQRISIVLDQSNQKEYVLLGSNQTQIEKLGVKTQD